MKSLETCRPPFESRARALCIKHRNAFSVGSRRRFSLETRLQKKNREAERKEREEERGKKVEGSGRREKGEKENGDNINNTGGKKRGDKKSAVGKSDAGSFEKFRSAKSCAETRRRR